MLHDGIADRIATAACKLGKIKCIQRRRAYTAPALHWLGGNPAPYATRPPPAFRLVNLNFLQNLNFF